MIYIPGDAQGRTCGSVLMFMVRVLDPKRTVKPCFLKLAFGLLLASSSGSALAQRPLANLESPLNLLLD